MRRGCTDEGIDLLAVSLDNIDAYLTRTTEVLDKTQGALRTQLLNLGMKGTDYAAYLDKFNSIHELITAFDPPMDPQSACWFFIRGLHPRLGELVNKQPTGGQWTQLRELQVYTGRRHQDLVDAPTGAVAAYGTAPARQPQAQQGARQDMSNRKRPWSDGHIWTLLSYICGTPWVIQ